MVAQVRLTALQGTLTSVALVRLTQLNGQLAGQVSIRLTQLVATNARATNVRLTQLSALAAGRAGAPALTVPGALDVSSGAALKLSATAVPESGFTIASWTWRIVSRDAGAPLPVFSDPTIAHPLMSVPPSLTQYAFVIGVRATDSAGRVSGESTIPVLVHRADYMTGKGGSWNVPTMITHGTDNGWG